MVTRRDFLKLAGGLAGGLTGAAAGSACAANPHGSRSGGRPDLLVAEVAGGLAVLDVRRREPLVAPVPGIPSADWSRLYVTRPERDRTLLATLDAANGREIAAVGLPGKMAARAVSATGRLVALTEPAPRGHSAYRPIGRRQSTITVVDPTGESRPKRLVLAGNYEVDAFSADDQRLFVLQYLPAAAPDHYRVRVVDLATGAVGPLLGRNKAPVPSGAEEEMRGEGRQAVLAPIRGTLYTLYTHQPDHLHTRDLLAGGRRGKEVHAFVHVLSLTEGWAYCLDMPEPFGRGPAAAHTLALTPDGGRLFVADLSTGRLVVADTAQLEITRTVRLGGPGGGPWATRGEFNVPAAAQVAADGGLLYLGAAGHVHAVDGSELTVLDTWRVGGDVRGLAPSPDRGHLYIGQQEHAVLYDTASGRELDRLAVPGLTAVRHVIRRAGELP